MDGMSLKRQDLDRRTAGAQAPLELDSLDDEAASGQKSRVPLAAYGAQARLHMAS